MCSCVGINTTLSWAKLVLVQDYKLCKDCYKKTEIFVCGGVPVSIGDKSNGLPADTKALLHGCNLHFVAVYS